MELKNLRSLSVELKRYDSKSVERLFGMFEYKNLQSLSVEVDDDILPDLPGLQLLKDVWRADQFHNLEDLTLKIRPTFQDVYEEPETSPRFSILSHFLGECTSLQNIYLERPGGDDQFFGFSNRLAALHLKNC